MTPFTLSSVFQLSSVHFKMLLRGVLLVLCVVGSNSLQFNRSAETNKSVPVEEWFEQRLDHFNGQVDTVWKQRFFRNDAHFKPGGPVFLLLEVAMEVEPMDVNQGAWVDYAKSYNALCFLLEHRYYGKSRPTSDLSVENLAYLSSEQALADIASFIEAMNRKLGTGTRWILFGGSYAGSLAAWARLKYPHLVHAAVASSAQMTAVADFSDYFKVIVKTLRAIDPSCVEELAAATQQLEELLNNGTGQQTVSNLFRPCNPVHYQQHGIDKEDFFFTLGDQIVGVVQNGEEDGHTVAEICSFMKNTTAGSALQRRASLSNHFLREQKKSCLEIELEKNILRNTSWEADPVDQARQWAYQYCTEFGYFLTSTQADTERIFGHFSLDSSDDECEEIFGPKFTLDRVLRGIAWTNSNYGGLNYVQTRTVFVHGSYDPWHTVGITSDIGPDTPAIFIKGAHSCADMYSTFPGDSSQLIEARKKISSLIGRWLNDTSAAN